MEMIARSSVDAILSNLEPYRITPPNSGVVTSAYHFTVYEGPARQQPREAIITVPGKANVPVEWLIQRLRTFTFRAGAEQKKADIITALNRGDGALGFELDQVSAAAVEHVIQMLGGAKQKFGNRTRYIVCSGSSQGGSNDVRFSNPSAHYSKGYFIGQLLELNLSAEQMKQRTAAIGILRSKSRILDTDF